jgi:hypothetical protein
VRELQEHLAHAHAALANFPPPAFALARAAEAPRRVRIRELIANRALELLAGIPLETRDQPEGDSDKKATRVLGLWDFRDERPRFTDPSNPPAFDPIPKTQPGDIILAPSFSTTRAFIDEEGGNLLAAPLQALRTLVDWLNPYVLAAFITSPASLRLAAGSTTARISIRELEIPQLDAEQTWRLGETLRRLDTEHHLGMAAAHDAITVKEALIDAIGSGTAEIAPPH